MVTPHTPQPAEVIARIDGASRGNPGPAAYAVVLGTVEGGRLAAFSKFLGPATNNVAEYQALLAALDYAYEHRHRRLRVLSDSELLVRQIEGRYKVKSPELKPLHERGRQKIARLEAFSIAHIPREQNREADRLAKQALNAAGVGAGLRPAPTIHLPERGEHLQASATYRQGSFQLNQPLPLEEGEKVDLVIRRKKARAR